MMFVRQSVFLCLVTAMTLQAEWREDAGDIIQVLLPATALGMTFVKDDMDGTWMFAKQGATTFGIVHTTKYAVDKWRPKGQNPDSFPSGHTAAAFSGASFLQTRYGAAYGVPAYALATFVGYSRIYSQNHYYDDVIAGASVAMLSNWAFTEPYSTDVHLSAEAVDGGVKIAANVPLGGERDEHTPSVESDDLDYTPDVRFIFEFGAASMRTNNIDIDGAPIYFDALAQTADPTTSIRSGFAFYYENHEVYLQISSYELRAVGQLQYPVTVGSSNFNITDETQMGYIWDEYVARWRYDLLESNLFVLKAGLGISTSYTQVNIATETPVQSEEQNSLWAVPIAHLHGGVNLGNSSVIFAEVDAGAISDYTLVDATIQYQYHINKNWDVGAGYCYQNVNIDTAALNNKLVLDHYIMNVSYGFTL